MGTNNTSYVVSFSIVILLLLLLLLLLTYNSKCSMNNTQYSPYMMEGFNNAKKDKFENYKYETDPNKASSGITGGNEVYQQLEEHFYEPKIDIDAIVKNTQNQNRNKNEQFSAKAAAPPPAEEGFLNYSELNESSSLNPNSNSKEFQSCFPRDRLTANDLLPKDAADSKWARLNPSGAGDIHDQNYLTAGYHIGINTVGQSMRNANLQLRSEIPNPQTPVGPWMISTIEPDLRQNTLEIGSAPSF